MSRRRWVYVDGEAIEVKVDYVPDVPVRTQIMGDSHYDGMYATDGTDISTRTKHREYMRRTGLAVADDFKNEWALKQKQREAFRQGTHSDPQLRRTLEKEFHRRFIK